ncbi:MAG TPA: endonuclease III [Bacteroidales bacterium]
MKREELFEKVQQYFQKTMPVAEPELNFRNEYELIVAVILSAQCTDKRVNMTTPAFFEKYPTPLSLSKANVDDIYQLIKSISYPNNKAKNLLAMAQMLVTEFGGKLPTDTQQMQRLPGVGRKTAHVLGAVLFDKPVLAVDTHVFRVAARIGLTVNAKNPLECEKQLTRYLPADILPTAHHWLILHGRYVCLARSPKCKECGLTEVCKHFKMMIND